MDQALRNTIRDLIVDRQRRERWPDGHVAGLLGISRGYWWAIRSGVKPMTWSVAMRALQQFPEYTPAALSSFLAAVAPLGCINASSEIEEPAHAGR